MIKLFNTPNYIIDTSIFSNLLHDNIVNEFEDNFAKYVGAKYACMANSASSLIYLALKRFKPSVVSIPSIIPPVVPNMVINAGHKISFNDDVKWVGAFYKLHEDVYDSAQQVEKNQYSNLQDNDAVMIFSFYPTKPISSCDGGMIVSNNKDKIDYFRIATMNGSEFNKNSWSRKQLFAGYKMHPNSIQAYIANENLKKLDTKNDILERIRMKYNLNFGYVNTSNHLYRLRVRDNISCIEYMQKFDIQCGLHYKCCHTIKCYSDEYVELPFSEREEKITISLPFHEELTNDDTDKVIHYAKNLEII